MLQRTLRLGELDLVVDAEHLGDRRRSEWRDLDLVLHRHRDDVGQVVLALRIGIAQLGEPTAQALDRHRHDAGVALADLALAGVRVLLFDDPQYFATRIAHDAAVSGGIGELDGEQSERLRTRERDQRAQRLRLHQRHIAVEHEHDLIVMQRRQRLLHGVPGALLLRLQHPGAARRNDGEISGERGLYLLATVTVHDMHRGGLEGARSREYMPEQRPTGERLQNFRQRGVHPFALTCCQDDDGERHEGRTDRSAAGLAKFLQHPELRGSADELSERLGLLQLVEITLQSLFSVPLGLEGGRLIEILRPYRRVREHRDLLRLHFERATPDEEQEFLARRSLYTHFTSVEERQQRRVAWRDAYLALNGRHEHHLRRARIDLALGADDVAMDGAIGGHV